MFVRNFPSRHSLTIAASVLCCCLTVGGALTDAADRTQDLGMIGETAWSAFVPPVWLRSQTQDSWTRLDLPAIVEQDQSRSTDLLANRIFENQIDRTQPWHELQQPAEIIRAQSLDGCGDIAEGCGYQEPKTPSFRLTEFNIYPTFSYLDSASATYNEFEFASQTDFGFLEMENRTVLNVADLPGTIALGPTNPGASGSKVNVRANGFGDILSGFFFSQKGSHENNVHIGVGPVITFPTASNEILGSSQYTAGPGIHASAEIGKLTTGFFLWQSWGFDLDAGDKRVNQLFGKPFILYELSEKWNLIYIPLGLSHSWHSKSSDAWTVPVGGGFRRLCTVRGQKMGIQMQAFDYVARKSKDPEWELRFTIEFLFDD